MQGSSEKSRANPKAKATEALRRKKRRASVEFKTAAATQVHMRTSSIASKSATKKRRSSTEFKAAVAERTSSVAHKAATKKRRSSAKVKAAVAERTSSDAYKAVEKVRDHTEARKTASRASKKRPVELEANACRKSKRRLRSREEESKCRIQFARASRPDQVTSQDGTWTRAAMNIAHAEDNTALPIMPPSFCALNDAASLRKIADMYHFLDKLQWCTCVVCWRAWFSVPFDHVFHDASRPGSASHSQSEESWFRPASSATLRMLQRKQVNRWVMEYDACQGDAARLYLCENYGVESSEDIMSKLADANAGRGICICTSCAPHVEEHTLKPWTEVRLCDYAIDPVSITAARGQDPFILRERWEDSDADLLNAERPHDESSEPVSDSSAITYVLGHSIQDFAEGVASLSDSEEMVLALVHPLVQVYTIPKTGQLAYVGHVCNFRQKVTSFLSSLPTLPSDMPFVMVRPRIFKNQRSPKAPFKIDIDKVRKAFQWLKQHNPYYHDVEWISSAETAWRDEDVLVGSLREEEFDLEHGLHVDRAVFVEWMQRGANHHDVGEGGFPIAARALSLFHDEADESEPDEWNQIRALAATTFDRSPLRAASSLELVKLAVILYAKGVLKLDLPQDLTINEMVVLLRTMDTQEWHEDLHIFCCELHVVQEQLRQDQPLESAGGITEAVPDDDVGLRQNALESMTKHAGERFGDGGAEDAEDACEPVTDSTRAPDASEKNA